MTHIIVASMSDSVTQELQSSAYHQVNPLFFSLLNQGSLDQFLHYFANASDSLHFSLREALFDSFSLSYPHPISKYSFWTLFLADFTRSLGINSNLLVCPFNYYAIKNLCGSGFEHFLLIDLAPFFRPDSISSLIPDKYCRQSEVDLHDINDALCLHIAFYGLCENLELNHAN